MDDSDARFEQPHVVEPASHRVPSVVGWDQLASPLIESELQQRKVCLGEFDPGPAKFSWLRPRMLWLSRNDVLEKWAGKKVMGMRPVVNRVREAWIARLAETQDPKLLAERFAIDRWADRESLSLLVVGDTGEGDRSQVVTTPPLNALSSDADAMVILSDVLYPAGEVNEYAGKVHFPYRDVRAPIVAIPGNHDWYDLLEGFATHFCEAVGGAPQAGMSRLQGWLWRASDRRNPKAAALEEGLRELPGHEVRQRGPFWTLDCAEVRFVGIDTGIDGSIDATQARWLIEVSADPRPKVLLTGKPLVVNGETHLSKIDWGGPAEGGVASVADIVRDAANNYVAVIGGDTHNYQRYLCRLRDGRWQTYVVAGGGGAYMHATHIIDRIEIGGEANDPLSCTEADVRLYPLRGGSLSRYSRLLRGPFGLLRIGPEAAALEMQRVTDVRPAIDTGDANLRWRDRVRASVLRHTGGRGFQRRVSEFFDWDDPPFFKHALLVDVSPGELRIRCYGITGVAGSELEPPVEDDVRIPLDAQPAGGSAS